MKSLLYLLLPAFLLVACDENIVIKEGQPIPLKAGMDKKVQQDNAFSFELLRQVIATSTDKNVFISPLSVSIALGMARNGADTETLREMEKALKMSGMTDEQINEYYKIMLESLPGVDESTKLNIANSLWYRIGFPVKEPFLQINKDYFNAEVRGLDFSKESAVDVINDWCAEKTNDLIKKPLDKISSDAMLYLINAIYFKGVWSQKFDKRKTYESDFTTETGAINKVNMMNMKDTFPYAEDDMAQYLDMPYGNKAFSMTVILPKTGKTTAGVLKELDQDKWNEITAMLHTREVQVSFPRFKVQNKFELKTPMMNMGMKLAFTDIADFSRISDIDLLISRIIHSTYCEVNEEGTEAAAVTIIEMELTSMPMIPYFTADRPFIFVIREKSSGVILFTAKMGSVEKY
jgi:serpin B